MRQIGTLVVVLACLCIAGSVTTPAMAGVTEVLAASATHSPVVASPSDDLLPLTPPDHNWHSPGFVGQNVHPAGQLLLSYGLDDPSDPEPDANDVVRHRGFRKALLIILVCGGLIRLLTSPAYLKFIRDVLDPKSY